MYLAFMWHATIVLQSASLITSAIQLQNLAVTDDDDGAFAFVFVFVFKYV